MIHPRNSRNIYANPPPLPKLKRLHPEPNDPETELNTRLNALLYHTSDESVDLYCKENTDSDLLGRLGYDDYDAASAATSAAISPAISPVLLPVVLSENLYKALAAITPVVSPASADAPQDLERRIAFDNTNDSRVSVTHKIKHPQFRFRRNNKTYMAAHNRTGPSLRAIEWVIDEMMVSGDTVIILEVLDERHFSAIDKVEVLHQLDILKLLNKHHKKIQLVYEVVVGNPRKELKFAIAEYNPAMMAMGTSHSKDSEHRKFMQKQSFLRSFLECALVPVIIIKPQYKHIETLDHQIDGPRYFLQMLIDAQSEAPTASPRGRSASPMPRPRLLPSLSGSHCHESESRGRSGPESKDLHESHDRRFWFSRLPSGSRSRLVLRQRASSRLSKLFS